MTSRKSEIRKTIDGFVSYEISPLTPKQIISISSKWFGDNKDFITELEKKPYKDLANRPIFLTFLLILFKRYSSLPAQPSEIYDEIVMLIIEDWDKYRGIYRTSKYVDFKSRKKMKFLSELSYLLTYKIKQIVFSSKELENIYIAIHEKYNLPLEEMKDVVSEIESHTGLITEAGFKSFEFSHLSLQEFLCAKHLVDLPCSQTTINYFFDYPEPISIAISISTEPSIWFSNFTRLGCDFTGLE